ncbi:MaoC/PaaZ C-terminal domain-containing protein [Saccharomonospora saliphila]|uniref:MaoC/PaaZ C-terminal domain-containing protein n=1 Tax=Saccharomonospora saliphila TaxID=369829 RepID=UPI00048FDEFB|nr:MaoC/PaaZ C-terminal domain-containing protein [Saccharomonospora saliphila]
MPIDPDIAVGADLGESTISWTADDVLLYHLALGAGAEPTDERELRYTYENDLRVLPTFATVAPRRRTFEPPAVTFPGIEVDLARMLYGAESVEVHRPIPTEGEAVCRARITDVLDKGTAAVIVRETEAADPAGTVLWTSRSALFARGEGGFGGPRGRTRRVSPPDTGPDVVVDTPTLPQQALLYRLCGDRNPLHVDPAFARSAGFDAPILHGLATYGLVAKAVTDAVLDADVTRVRAWSATFAGVVRPGETLRTRVWRDDDRLLVTTTVPERAEAPVLADAVLYPR